MKKNGPYTIKSRKQIYKNPWIEVVEDNVIKPDGSEGVFGTIDYGNGIAVLAINEKREVYLIKEYYYVLEKYGIQLPVGGIDKNETPLEAAKRELMEETGVSASTWINMGIINPHTTAIKDPMEFYLALNIKEESEPKEKGIEVFKTPFEKVFDMAMNSEITSAPSVVLIFKVAEWLKNNKL